MISRRNILALPLLQLASQQKSKLTQKDEVMRLLDSAGIDFADPSKDGTKYAISVAVDGAEVTGTEGGMIIVRFDHRGRLIGLVVWNEKFDNDHTPA